MTAGDEDEEGGDADSSSGAAYCSLSDGIVTPDSAMGFGGSSDAMTQAEVQLRREIAVGMPLAEDEKLPSQIELRQGTRLGKVRLLEV